MTDLRVQHLDLPRRHGVVVVTGSFDYEGWREMVDAIMEMWRAQHPDADHVEDAPLVLGADKELGLSVLDEDDMRAAGWQRIPADA